MTLTELSQLHYLQKEIAHDEERIRMIREQACSTAVSTDGMPKTSSGRSKVAYAGESIADLETISNAGRNCAFSKKSASGSTLTALRTAEPD